MKTALAQESLLRRTVKAAVEEVFEERKDFMSEILEEAMLDIGLARAIRAGENSRKIGRRAVIGILKARS